MANKIYFIVFLWLCCFFSASAQVWPKNYGQQNRREYATDIIETYDKGYLICGYYNSPDYSQRWGWLIKTDVNGEIIWEKILENTGSRFKPFAIEQTQDGCILICGMSLHNNKSMPIVIKLNACGEKEWCKVFDGSPNIQSTAVDIKETEDGDLVILVSLYGTIPEETIHLFKLNAYGDVLWKKPYASMFNYPNTQIKQPESLFLTSFGKYIISGSGYWEQPWNPGGSMPLTALFIMVDSTGNEEWVLPFGLNDTIIGGAINVLQLNETGFIGVGWAYPSSYQYGFLMNFNDQGNQLGFNLYNFNNLSAQFNDGRFYHIKKIDSLFLLGSYFGNTNWANKRPPGELLIEDFNSISNLNIIDYSHYLQNYQPYRIASLETNKYLSTSTYPHSSNNYDIFLAKLNLNLEYDTAYTAPITYDSLCTSGPPQSGFIYLNDCAIDMDLPGDANCDAVVNVNDIVSSVAKILGGIPQPFCPQNADVNGDGVLNVVDVVGTVNIIIRRRGKY